MSYSRRQLEALGETLGDSVTRREAGRIVYGGGGSSAPSTTTQVSDVPDWAKGYAKDTLAKASALTDINQNPYQAYGGERVAGFQPLQQTAMQSVSSPEAFGQTVQGYMSPYMQNVVDVQKRAAREQAGINQNTIAARAAQSGAFGGSGAALQQAFGQRDLSRQLDEIQKMGSQAAFQQGVQQANTAIGQQTQLGALQQQQAQRPLDLAYQDFLTQKNYPYQQLSYMSNLIRGTPMGMNTQSQVYQAPGSTLGQLGGIGAGLYGMSKMGMFAEGGEVDSYADGGLSIMDKFNDPEELMQDMDKLNEDQLRAIINSPSTAAEREAAQRELAIRASERSGLAGAYNQVPYDAQENMVRAAGGGILAFSGEDESLVPGDKEMSYGEQMSNVLGALGGIPLSAFKYLVSAPGGPGLLTPSKKAEATATPTAETPYDAGTATRRSAYEKETPKAAPKAAPVSGITAAIQKGSAAGAPEVTGTSLLEEAKKAREYFNEDNKTELAGLEKLIAKQDKKAAEIKKQALGKAIMDFGFNWAAQAAKPGQGGGLGGALRSAAGAAPAFAASVNETNKLASAAEDNANKLQIEFTKYRVALSKGDTQAAMQHATNVRQLQQSQAQIALKEKELAQTGAYQQGMLGLQGRKLDLSERSAAASGLTAAARLAEVRRKAVLDFDTNQGRRLMAQLETQYGKGSPQAQYQYNQARSSYVQDALGTMRDKMSDDGAAVRSVYDLLSGD